MWATVFNGVQVPLDVEDRNLSFSDDDNLAGTGRQVAGSADLDSLRLGLRLDFGKRHRLVSGLWTIVARLRLIRSIAVTAEIRLAPAIF